MRTRVPVVGIVMLVRPGSWPRNAVVPNTLVPELSTCSTDSDEMTGGA